MLVQLGLLGALGAGMLGTGEAGGGRGVSTPGFVTVTNDFPGAAFFKSLSIFPVDGLGALVPGVFFDAGIAPFIREGDSTSVTPRAFESFQFLLSNQGLKYVFADAAPWETGEKLTFRFSIIMPPGAEFAYDLQFEETPAPGAAAVLGLGAMGLVSRRRRPTEAPARQPAA